MIDILNFKIANTIQLRLLRLKVYTNICLFFFLNKSHLFRHVPKMHCRGNRWRILYSLKKKEKNNNDAFRMDDVINFMVSIFFLNLRSHEKYLIDKKKRQKSKCYNFSKSHCLIRKLNIEDTINLSILCTP